MPDYLLHHMPGTCSRVALNALEEVGVPYREQGVALMRGAQRTPAYPAINPKGKVPVLQADEVVVTEFPVILFLLSEDHLGARLLPADQAELVALSDLVWISGVLHPLASRPMRPAAIAAGDPEGVTAMAFKQLADHADRIEARLAAGPWWYGDRWSIVDMFIAWVFAIAAQLGFPPQRLSGADGSCEGGGSAPVLCSRP